MDFTQLAKDAGCLASATEDVTRRLEAHFAGETPSPEAVQQWLEGTLKPAAAHLFPQLPTSPWERLGIERIVWESLSPSTKLAMARQLQPPVPARPNRPQRYTATAEQVASIEGLSPAERLTAYRAWVAAQQGQG
jgi:hypothetical protein